MNLFIGLYLFKNVHEKAFTAYCKHKNIYKSFLHLILFLAVFAVKRYTALTKHQLQSEFVFLNRRNVEGFCFLVFGKSLERRKTMKCLVIFLVAVSSVFGSERYICERGGEEIVIKIRPKESCKRTDLRSVLDRLNRVERSLVVLSDYVNTPSSRRQCSHGCSNVGLREMRCQIEEIKACVQRLVCRDQLKAELNKLRAEILSTVRQSSCRCGRRTVCGVCRR